MTKKYAIGIDFGTLSGRAALVDVGTGDIVAQSVREYAHGVMDEQLPDGTRLPPDWALQDPQDYLDVLLHVVPEVVRASGAASADVIGVALDFTACTILPVDRGGRPLCFDETWRHNPHAWVKLWKHHGAQKQANRLTELAQARGEAFLARYGGKVSSEWLIPKVMQIVEEAPEIYEAADRIIEAGDWVTMQMTGAEARSSCFAGYKGMWHKQTGYPSKEFLRALHPKLENLVADKLSTDIHSLGTKAGELTAEMAEKLGLQPGTAVGVPAIDAHIAVPAVGITEPGELLMIIGTSSCDMLLGAEERLAPGICGVVEDGILPGMFGYEAGQCCVGDHFDWFVKNCVPEAYVREAKQKGVGIHQLLTEKAEKLRPGESGLIALDWWNGNRSVLVDAELSGMMVGMTLTTKPEEMYRALIEATAFGKRVILDNFERNGLPISRLYATGGISRKNRMMMQIYADVTGKEIYIGTCEQTAAVGGAMFGAVAAGKAKGGYDTIFDAAKAIGRYDPEPYRPNPGNREIYEKLYREFLLLHDYFGRGANDVMKRLKAIKQAERG